jgi:hypothetical protein
MSGRTAALSILAASRARAHVSPETVVTARNSSSGLTKTNASANASSISLPMSVSSTMGMGLEPAAARALETANKSIAKARSLVFTFRASQEISGLPQLGSVPQMLKPWASIEKKLAHLKRFPDAPIASQLLLTRAIT